MPLGWHLDLGTVPARGDAGLAARLTELVRGLETGALAEALDDVADEMQADFLARRLPPVEPAVDASGAVKASGKGFRLKSRAVRIVLNTDDEGEVTTVFHANGNDAATHNFVASPESKSFSFEGDCTDELRALLKAWPSWLSERELPNRELVQSLEEAGLMEAQVF